MVVNRAESEMKQGLEGGQWPGSVRSSWLWKGFGFFFQIQLLPPYPQGIRSKTPMECLKPMDNTEPFIYYVFFYAYKPIVTNKV